jgi:methionyl-tRNA formyltransferase
MRLLLLLNNWNGWEVAKWLRQRKEEIVGLILNPPGDQRFGEEILAALQMPAEKIWFGDQLRKPDTLAELRDLRADIGISASFGYILKPELIQMFPHACINLHAALLPYNGGWYTNVWPILDGTPAGATIHYIDAGVDSGDIIVQRKIPVQPTDTGGTLHEKITRDLIELFKENWPSIRAGTNSRTPQDRSKGTTHRKAEIDAISGIDLDRKYLGRELINLLRARTYIPYPSAYYVEGEKRTYVRIELRRERDMTASENGRSARETFPVGDLNAEYRAADLLKLLGVHDSSPDRFVQFKCESGPLFARAYIVDEREFRPAASPEWMTGG